MVMDFTNALPENEPPHPHDMLMLPPIQNGAMAAGGGLLILSTAMQVVEEFVMWGFS